MAGEFTGNSIDLFPYSLASKEDQTIYSTECVPDNFTLSDPDHLKTFQIEELYKHWLARQRKGLEPFVILNSSPQHGSSRKSQKSAKAKGKKKMEYVEVDDEQEGKSECKEEDQEDVPMMEEEEDEDEEDEQADQEMDVTPEEELEQVRMQLRYSEDGQEKQVDQGPVGLYRKDKTTSGLKFGPPIRKLNKIPSSTQQSDGPTPIAGPSKRPQPNPSLTQQSDVPTPISGPSKQPQPNPSLTQQSDDPTPIAGPSKRPQPKQKPRKKISQKSKLGKGETKETGSTDGRKQDDRHRKLPIIDLRKKLGPPDVKGRASFPSEVSAPFEA
jgi:hypothetical protein